MFQCDLLQGQNGWPAGTLPTSSFSSFPENCTMITYLFKHSGICFQVCCKLIKSQFPLFFKNILQTKTTTLTNYPFKHRNILKELEYSVLREKQGEWKERRERENKKHPCELANRKTASWQFNEE